MTAALLLGAGCGLGLAAIAFGLAPARPPLAAVLAALTRPSQPARATPLEEGGWAARAGRPFAAVPEGLGLPGDRVRSDLAVLGRPPGRQLAEQATAAIAGLLLPPAVNAVLALGGVRLGWQLPAVASVILGAAGFMLPDLSARAEASRRRDDFRQADDYVVQRLRTLMVKKRGRNLHAGQAQAWTEDWFNGHGLHRLRGTIRYPKAA